MPSSSTSDRRPNCDDWILERSTVCCGPLQNLVITVWLQFFGAAIWTGLQFFVHGRNEMLIWMGFVAECNSDGEVFGSGPQILQGKAQQWRKQGQAQLWEPEGGRRFLWTSFWHFKLRLGLTSWTTGDCGALGKIFKAPQSPVVQEVRPRVWTKVAKLGVLVAKGKADGCRGWSIWWGRSMDLVVGASHFTIQERKLFFFL